MNYDFFSEPRKNLVVIFIRFLEHMQDLHSFFNFSETEYLENQNYQPLTWGASVLGSEFSVPVEEADIVIVACGEMRGAQQEQLYSNGPQAILEQFFNMYQWHPEVKVGFAGFLKQGLTTSDSEAALRTVLDEIQASGKTVIVLGGSHDLMMQQYEAYKKQEKLINAAAIDMLIDLEEAEEITDKSFLMDMLTSEPNYIKNYSHIGFQSYFVQPKMLETLDKLRFDFYRLGKVREQMEEIEPVIRHTDLLSFDLSAVRYSDAPSNINGSPNGFTGDEACLLTKYAGMSEKLSSFGIYGYLPEHDQNKMTAKLIAQMLWYFIDGYYIRKQEAALTEKDEFLEFSIRFSDNDCIFLKSKKTNRWWMQMPDKTFIPCSYQDYLIAANNDIPERWMREQERLA